MSNDLIIAEGMAYEEIARLTGQDTGKRNGSNLTRLVVNRHHEIEVMDGILKTVPAGSYSIATKDGQFFAREAYLRPLLMQYQYQYYDQSYDNGPGKAKGKMMNRSIFSPDLFGDMPDELGGNKCGKISKKNLSSATPDQIALSEKVKCRRFVFGIVRFGKDAVNLDGEPATVENVPVVWASGGETFLEIGEEFDKLNKQKRNMIFHEFVFSKPVRKVNGSNVYYNPGGKFDISVGLNFGSEELELLKMFRSTVDAENEQIMEKHKQSLKARLTPGDIAAQDAISTINSNLADALNDDIPF